MSKEVSTRLMIQPGCTYVENEQEPDGAGRDGQTRLARPNSQARTETGK